ncbi:GreA/GreB family elongation factor [Aquimarina algicola]|uniref:3-oxoacyl-ACP synthase n=1 Tax=Aquimarina algicola TaxID=2589995 RepID=A0A504J9V2_9FLAO|nr:GreA/GreB family elongation factor [Aquimarina algicola]TPN87716.1 3-oxoacyl-ACP synthase [Aquimarina algicola]
MHNISDTKHILLKYCKEYVDQRQQKIIDTIADLQQSLTTETKSTAGDKHETGRAMLQLEREKAGVQLAEIQKLQEIVNKIDITISSGNIRLGSLVVTSEGTYFISLPIGIYTLNQESFFIIAVNSPIGRVLLGKKIGDTIRFRDKNIFIKAVY